MLNVVSIKDVSKFWIEFSNNQQTKIQHQDSENKLLFFMKFYIPCKISLYRSLIDTFHPLLYVIFTTYLFPKFCVLLFVITIDDFVRLNIFS